MSPEVRRVIKEVLLPRVPEVPEWTPERDKETWVFGSGLKAGYLLALRNLGVELDD